MLKLESDYSRIEIFFYSSTFQAFLEMLESDYSRIEIFYIKII